MIPAQYYNIIYLLFLLVMTIVMSLKYASYSDSRINSTQTAGQSGAICLTIVMILFFGLRPLSYVFVDMMNYYLMYGWGAGKYFIFDLDTENFIFDNLFNYMSSNRLGYELFFFIIAAIYIGFIYLACRKLFPNDTTYAMVIYLAAFSTFSYGTNGIKAGAAASIFLLAIPYWRKWVIPVIILIISLGFHHSMVLPIVAFICAKFYHKPKIYFLFWVLCIILAAAHITAFQELFASMADDRGAEYLEDNDSGYRSGFRLDFIAYSAAPILLGRYLMNRKGYQSETYDFIFCLYTFTNAIWILCMYASFTNRIAYLSWFMLPIVLIYPFLDYWFENKQYKALNSVAWGHLAFTLIMTFIYYGAIFTL